MDDNKELIAVVEIPKYIRKVQVSAARRATYYLKGEKLALKYKNKIGIDYQWCSFPDGKIYLCNAKKEKVIKNPDSAGLPKYKIINGQDLHTLTLQDYERSKIITAIKEQMIPAVTKLEPITQYPLLIEMELWDTFEDMELLSTKGRVKDVDWDIDNRSLFYCKTFPDVLCGCPFTDKDTGKLVYKSKVIIKDDSRQFMTQAPCPLFFPIDNTEDRKLVFKIYHDLRDIIKQSKHYELS